MATNKLATPTATTTNSHWVELCFSGLLLLKKHSSGFRIGLIWLHSFVVGLRSVEFPSTEVRPERDREAAAALGGVLRG